MLKSSEGQTERLLTGLSLERGKARICLEQQRDCNWAGCFCCCYRKGKHMWGSRCFWRGSIPSQYFCVSHQCRQERSWELHAAPQSWRCSSSLHILYLWQECPAPTVVLRRQNSIFLALLRSVSQLWLPERLKISISDDAVCWRQSWNRFSPFLLKLHCCA